MVPNIISVFRICLVPVFIIAYFSDQRDIKIYAILIYALASFSDFLDGYLARKFEAQSNLGKFLDPLGDKLMTVAVLVCITIGGLIPIWAVIVACVKEFLMAIGGFVVHKVGHAEIPPSNLIGKISTAVFFLVCVSVMIFKLPETAVTIMIAGAVGLAVLTFASYIITYIKVMKNRERNA